MATSGYPTRLLDLNLLRALDALLTEQNVTRAAERTCVTQQAMSGSLRRLRDHFDDELLIRVGRHLEPTPLAHALRRPIRDVILQIDQTLDIKPIFEPLRSCRQFRVAMSDYAGITFLPFLTPLLSVEAPNISIDIRPINNQVHHDVEQGELDFCLLPHNWRLYQSSSPAGLKSLTLFEDDFVCVIDAAHPDVGDGMSGDQYAALPHCVARFGSGVRSLVEQAWVDARLPLHIAATATTFTHLLFMVAGTRMVATAQRKLFAALQPMLRIRATECPIAIERLNESLSWHERNDGDQAHSFMRDLFANAARAMAGHV